MPSTTEIYKKWNSAVEHHQCPHNSTEGISISVKQPAIPHGMRHNAAQPESRNASNSGRTCNTAQHASPTNAADTNEREIEFELVNEVDTGLTDDSAIAADFAAGNQYFEVVFRAQD